MTGTELECGHNERFGLIGARNECLACQAEFLQMQVDELSPKMVKKTTITVRMPKELHKKCKLSAANAECSLNQWCVLVLMERVQDDEGHRSDPDRADQADGGQDAASVEHG